MDSVDRQLIAFLDMQRERVVAVVAGLDGEQLRRVVLRFIVLHMIEETARHLGHLDVVRELIDGRIALGQDAL